MIFFLLDDFTLATDGQDLASLHEDLTFLPGRLDEVKCVNVTTMTDGIYEGLEYQGIVLTSDSDITVNPGVAILSISDDDG